MGSGYGVISGTSMATPHVAGAAGVYKALHPTATPADVRSALRAAGSNAWAETTDRDSVHEPLLDMSSFGAPPGFRLRSTPPSLSTWAGYGQKTLSLVAVRGNGFTGQIDLSVEGLPDGLTGTFAPAELSGWATGPARLTVQAAAEVPAGTWDAEIVARSGDLEQRRPLQITVNVDAQAPTATVPRLAFVPAVTMSATSVPLRVTWSGADVGTGIAAFEAGEQRDADPMSAVPLSPAATTFRTMSGRLGSRYVEQVRAIDNVNNTGEWATAARVELAGFSEATSLATYAGRWATTSSSSAWGGKARYATAAGASVSFRFTGSSMAWVTTTGPTRGNARVYVNGTLVRTIDLRTSTTRYRQVVFTRDVTYGTYTVKVVVAGTSGRPRVDVDGFMVLRRR
jgi:hypothetical protein